MKVRWTESSLRLRITPTELALLETGEAIETRLCLPGAGWTVRVETGAGAATLCAANAHLRIFLGRADVVGLSDPANEGVYFTSGTFRYFIEKDFPCAHPRPADALEPTTEHFSVPPGFIERKM